MGYALCVDEIKRLSCSNGDSMKSETTLQNEIRLALGRKVSSQQDKFIEMVARFGGIGAIVRSVDEAMDVLKTSEYLP